MENYLVDLVFIVYGLILGTLGNLLYRVNNHLKINPIAIRILYGIMALALYVLMYLGLLMLKSLSNAVFESFSDD